MNTDPFEEALRRRPPRQIPAQWRDEILSAARESRATDGARHAARPASPPAGLRQLLWPSPVAWAGLAAVWLTLAGMNLALREPSPSTPRLSPRAAPQLILAWKEQARLLSELLNTPKLPVAERPEPGAPRPRSQRTGQTRLV